MIVGKFVGEIATDSRLREENVGVRDQQPLCEGHFLPFTLSICVVDFVPSQ